MIILDSEPLLGTWLEELLSSVPHLDVSMKKKQNVSRQLSRRRSTAAETALQGGSLRDTIPSNKKVLPSSTLVRKGIKISFQLISVSVDYLKLLGEKLLGGGGSTDFLKSHISLSFEEREIDKFVSIVDILEENSLGIVCSCLFGN